jgi:hypothetical protein
VRDDGVIIETIERRWGAQQDLTVRAARLLQRKRAAGLVPASA